MHKNILEREKRILVLAQERVKKQKLPSDRGKKIEVSLDMRKLVGKMNAFTVYCGTDGNTKGP